MSAEVDIELKPSSAELTLPTAVCTTNCQPDNQDYEYKNYCQWLSLTEFVMKREQSHFKVRVSYKQFLLPYYFRMFWWSKGKKSLFFIIWQGIQSVYLDVAQIEDGEGVKVITNLHSLNE